MVASDDELLPFPEDPGHACASFPRVYAEVPRYYTRLHAAARRLRRDGNTALHTRELLAHAALRVAGRQRVCPDSAARCCATGA